MDMMPIVYRKKTQDSGVSNSSLIIGLAWPDQLDKGGLLDVFGNEVEGSLASPCWCGTWGSNCSPEMIAKSKTEYVDMNGNKGEFEMDTQITVLSVRACEESEDKMLAKCIAHNLGNVVEIELSDLISEMKR